MYSFVLGDASWFECGNKDIGKQNDDPADKFKKCAFKQCLTLERGEISHCSKATNSYHIQGFDRKLTDYVPVEDTSSFEAKLKQYALSPEAMTACENWYGTRNDRVIPAARQMGE